MAIAYFSTWTTYGTWLPGDDRCWFQRGRGVQISDLGREFEASLQMTEDAVVLDLDQRRLVESAITRHSEIRKWTLHAVHCRTNHVHVVVTAPECCIEIPREQFKAWCTRKLKERDSFMRKNWWTRRGWDVYVDDEDHLLNAIAYVLEGQDYGGK